MRDRELIDRHGRAAAGTALARDVVGAAPLPAGEAAQDVAPEVLEFIRFCYRRRGIGWPELYDEMCCVAARGLFRGMDYDGLAALGVGFSLEELPRLTSLAQRVVAEERALRAVELRGRDHASLGA